MDKDFFEQDVVYKNYIFFLCIVLYALVVCGFLEYYGKDQLHLMFNQYHSPFWDEFFKYFTDLSLPIIGAIGLYVIIKNHSYKMLNYATLAFLITSILAIFIKRVFFEHGHRPTHYFKLKDIPLHLVEGVSSQIPYTYPSGHSATAFMCMLFFSMLSKKLFPQFLFFLLALLVALSRVYLSKHFFIDTVGGMILGVSVNVAVFYLYKNWNSSFLNKKILPK